MLIQMTDCLFCDAEDIDGCVVNVRITCFAVPNRPRAIDKLKIRVRGEQVDMCRFIWGDVWVW